MANVQTDDGSLWVWIPRYAYKIIYNNPDDKSAGGKIDVMFLKGTANKNENDIDVTSLGYTVHPAFKNGNETNFSNCASTEYISQPATSRKYSRSGTDEVYCICPHGNRLYRPCKIHHKIRNKNNRTQSV